MARHQCIGVLFCAVLSVLSVAGPAIARESSENLDQVLKEVNELKEIVQKQQKRIEDLESMIAQREPVSGGAGPSVTISEIDKRIDERFSRKVPGYGLMEGASLGVGTTTVVQSAHHANGDGRLSKREDVTDISIVTDITLEKKFEDYGEAFVYVTAGRGAGLDDDLKMFCNVNDNADDGDNVRLAEAWYEHYLRPVPGAVTAGKLDPANYIDNNEYASSNSTQFLGAIFGNSPVIEFPSKGPGLRLGLSPYDNMELNAVALDADADGEDIFDSMFLAAEINLKPEFFGKPGNYRFLAWSNNSAHTRWSDTSRDKERSYGYGISFDQELTLNAGLFARWGWQNPRVYLNGDDFSLYQSWSAGPQFKGGLWGRPDDVTGMGFGQIIPSHKYKAANNLIAKPENHFEWYYNLKLNDHFSISPDLQIIGRPYGKDAANGSGTIVVGGMRGQMDF